MQLTLISIWHFCNKFCFKRQILGKLWFIFTFQNCFNHVNKNLSEQTTDIDQIQDRKVWNNENHGSYKNTLVYYTFNIARTKGSYWKKICRITMTKNALEVNFFHVPHGYFLGRKSSLCVSRQEEFGTLVGICTSQGVSMILRVSQVSTWLFSKGGSPVL